MFAQLMRLPVNYYDTTSSGSLLSKMVYDVEQLAEAASSVITIIIRDSLTILALLGLLVYYSPELTLILLASAPLLVAGGQAYEARRFEDINRHNRRQFLKLAITNALSSPVIQFIVAVAFSCSTPSG